MFTSLNSILTPLVTVKATGILRIHHEYGEKAELFLQDGHIRHINNGKLTGQSAAHYVAKWLSIQHNFSNGEQPQVNHYTGLDTEDYINYLSNLNEKINEIKKIVPSNATKLKIQAFNFKGVVKLTRTDVSIGVLLDGKKTIAQLVSELGLLEYDLLHSVYKLYELGLVKVVGTHLLMEEADKLSFLQSLREILSKLVGPTNEIIISKAFNTIESEEETLAWNEIPDLILAISNQINAKAMRGFSKWWHENPYKYKALDN